MWIDLRNVTLSEKCQVLFRLHEPRKANVCVSRKQAVVSRDCSREQERTADRAEETIWDERIFLKLDWGDSCRAR